MTRPAILIAGIGNIFLGDDAFGSEVARQLGDLQQIEGVEVVDFGIRGLDLAYALADRCDVAILIDATAQNSPPGTLHLLELDLNAGQDAAHSGPMLEAHAMDPMKVLRAVRAMQGRVRRVLLVGCEPAELGPEEGQWGMSEVVAAAVPRAVEMVKRLVSEMLEENSPPQGQRTPSTVGKDGW